MENLKINSNKTNCPKPGEKKPENVPFSLRPGQLKKYTFRKVSQVKRELEKYCFGENEIQFI
jgi:hypothetical protein